MHEQQIRPFSPFSTLIVFLLLVCVGLALVSQLSIQLFPTRSFASITVQANLQGASPEVTELELTSHIESGLSRLKGIAKLSSVSEAGRASVYIELDKWTDPDVFRFEAASILRLMQAKLPDNASYPNVFLNKPDDHKGQVEAVLNYTFTGPGSIHEIARFAEETFRPAVASLKGINSFAIGGVKQEQIAIIIDHVKIKEVGSNTNDLQHALTVAFRSVDLGVVSTNEGKQTFFLPKAIDNIDQLKQFPVKVHEGRLFRLMDLADVEYQIPPDSYAYRINGQDQVNFSFYPDKHVNTIELAGQINKLLEAKMNTLSGDYRLILNYDATKYIKEELNKIYLRTGLSVLILLLFVVLITRQLRYVLIILAALAANVFISFIFYYFFKLEIHLYSLAGITISLGLVVDNVIVVVEDIRHTGRNRIFAAILASTLTTLGALSVIFLLEESQRINLMDFSIAIIINLIVSLPIAYFLIPALLDTFPIDIKKGKHLLKRRRLLAWFSKFYMHQLHFMLRWRYTFLLLAMLAFGLPLFLLPTKIQNQEESDQGNIWVSAYNSTIGSNFYNKNLRAPLNKYLGGMLQLYTQDLSSGGQFRQQNNEAEERTRLHVGINMVKGATFSQLDAICRNFEIFLQDHLGQFELFTTSIQSETQAQINIMFTKEASATYVHQLKGLLENKAIEEGAADFTVSGLGWAFNNALQRNGFDSALLIKGYNYQQLQTLAMIVRDSLKQHMRVRDVMISGSREWGDRLNYEHVVRFEDPQYLVVNNIGRWSASNALWEWAERSEYMGALESGSQSYRDVVIHHNKDNGPDVWQTMHEPVQVGKEKIFRLGNLSSIEKVHVGKQMVRENQEYLLYVNYGFIGTYQLDQMLQKRIMEGIQPFLPFGYKLQSVGWAGNGVDAFNYLWYIPLILFIIYMICAVLLESFKQPLAIIAMIPFSFIGVFLIFWLLGIKFDQGGYASLLLLSGLVTNAALYIVNDLNFISNGSQTIDEQNIPKYVKAFNAKAMPILITTLSAILSLLPFMLTGEETGFWFTLSAGTIGGLIFSLLGAYLILPLFLLPNAVKFKKMKGIHD